jgi:hypothetical protein
MLDERKPAAYDRRPRDNGNVIAWQDADTVTVNGSSYAITALKPDADFICLPDHRPPSKSRMMSLCSRLVSARRS